MKILKITGASFRILTGGVSNPMPLSGNWQDGLSRARLRGTPLATRSPVRLLVKISLGEIFTRRWPARDPVRFSAVEQARTQTWS